MTAPIMTAPAPSACAAWCRASDFARSSSAWPSATTLAGWVLNGEEGVEIHLEGAEPALDAFVRDLQTQPPPAASIAAIEVSAAEPRRLHGLLNPRERAQQSPHRAHLARPAGLRRLPARALRSRRPPLSVSLHQLHQLRPALHHHAGPALRPPEHDDAGVAARRVLRRPISTIPPTAAFTRSPWPAPPAARTTFCAAAMRVTPAGDDQHRGRRGAAATGSHRRHQRTRRLSPGLRRTQRRRRPRAARAQVPQGETVRRDGRESRDAARRLVELSPESEALLTSTARPIVLAPAQAADLPGVAPDNRRARRHAALHAAASSAVRRRRSGGAGDDQRQPLAASRSPTRTTTPCDASAGIADAFLIGERPIARRVDDSVARAGAFGPVDPAPRARLRAGRGRQASRRSGRFSPSAPI